MKIRVLTAFALLTALGFLLLFYNYKFCISVIIIISAIIQVEWELLIPRNIFSSNKSIKNITNSIIKNDKEVLIQSIVIFMGNIIFAVIALEVAIKNFTGIEFLSILIFISIFWLFSAIYALYKPIGSLTSLPKLFLYRILPSFTCIGIIFAFVLILNNIWIKDISLLLFILPLVWITDSAAYFIGRKFGKNKLALNISPNKSIEGAISGVIISTICISIAYFLINKNFSINLFIYFLFLSIISVIGDLFQSRLKREFNIKDSSQLLPGHGGFFDRFDAAIPVIVFSIYIPSIDIWTNIHKSLAAWI